MVDTIDALLTLDRETTMTTKHETAAHAHARNLHVAKTRAAELVRMLDSITCDRPDWGLVGNLSSSLDHINDAISCLQGEIR